jgi:uncharacterized protein (UPF0335 family)
MSTEGHNGIDGEALKELIQRIEVLEKEKEQIAEEIKSIYKDGKSAGFNPKVMRQVVVHRAQDPVVADAEETLFELYKRAVA